LPQHPETSNLSSTLKLSAAPYWFVINRNSHCMRSVNLIGNFQSYLSEKKKKIQHELERKKRKLERDHKVNLYQINFSEQLQDFINIINQVDPDTWKFREGSAIISSSEEQFFYQELFKKYALSQQARMYVLSADDIPISYLFGIISSNVFFALKTSYRENYSAYTPGTILFCKVIEQLFLSDPDIKRIELLGSDARWKEELANDTQWYCEYSIHKVGIVTSIYAIIYNYLKPFTKNYLLKSKTIQTIFNYFNISKLANKIDKLVNK
jgi:CelD/BcsL family acetyltransferase involved in cellulose biosynthesis